MEPSKMQAQTWCEGGIYLSVINLGIYILAYSLVLKIFKELVLIYNYGSQKHEKVKELGREPPVLS
jgi:hypothetical protein